MVDEELLPTIAAIEPFIDQMKRASDANLYYLALMGALTLPDILSALGSEDGISKGTKYQAWLVEHLGALESEAKQIWEFRCSLLHQGSTRSTKSDSWIAFADPSTGQAFIHRVRTEFGGEQVTWFSIPIFVDDIHRAVRHWLHNSDRAAVNRNLERFVRLRPEGLPPHIVGHPVIA